jgi:hypothetical protein
MLNIKLQNIIFNPIFIEVTISLFNKYIMKITHKIYISSLYYFVCLLLVSNSIYTMRNSIHIMNER